MTEDQKKHNQKFLPGDLVRVHAPSSWHPDDWTNDGVLEWKLKSTPAPEHGIEGIVSGSYADLYTGYSDREYHQYSIKPINDKGYKCAWYDEDELILVKTRAEMDGDRCPVT